MRSLLIACCTLIAAASISYGFPAIEVYEAVSPSVVFIRASKGSGAGMLGAGSVIARDGLVITNAHVVIDKESGKPLPTVEVYLKPKNITGAARKDLAKGYTTEVLRYSRELDLALLKVSGLPSGVNIVELSNPQEIKVGEEVVAIGHPEQGGLWSLTYGRISGEMNDYQGVPGKEMYQTDTSVNRGNSGGPLLDRRGYMVAVNSNIARVGADGLPITGVNFAIKSSVVRKWLENGNFTVAYGKKLLSPASGVTVGITVEPVKDKSTPKEEDKTAKAQKTEDRILTPVRPYDYDDLLKAAEKDLENMMDEMRGKIKRDK